MVSLNKIIYLIGTYTADGTPITIRELVGYLGDEENIYDRTRSFLIKYSHLFRKKIQDHVGYYVLSTQGKKRYDRIYNIYDPVLDKIIFKFKELKE